MNPRGDTDRIFVASLIPDCVSPNPPQKLWQCMTLFDEDNERHWASILDTANYSTLVGNSIAEGVAAACEIVPIG